MVQIETGQPDWPQTEFCQNFKPKPNLVNPIGSLILLQPADIQHFVSSNLSQPGDHNFVSNSLSVQPIQNSAFFDNFNATQQVIQVGPVYGWLQSPASNTATQAEMCQTAGQSPALTILGDSFQSPSTVILNLPQTGPSPEPLLLGQTQSVPGQLQTIPLMGDGQVRLLSAPEPASLSANNNHTNSTVNYLVQPGDLEHSAPIVVQASSPHNETSTRKSRSQKKGSFSEATISILKSWLFRNITHPYPTEEEKKELLCLTGMSLSQLNNWLINSRRRMLKRLFSTLEEDHVNLHSRSRKGTGGANSHYANKWKNKGVGEQCNSQNAQQVESDDGNEKSEVAIKNRKMSQSSDD